MPRVYVSTLGGTRFLLMVKTLHGDGCVTPATVRPSPHLNPDDDPIWPAGKIGPVKVQGRRSDTPVCNGQKRRRGAIGSGAVSSGNRSNARRPAREGYVIDHRAIHEFDVVDPAARPEHRLALSADIPGHAEPRREVLVIGVVRRTDIHPYLKKSDLRIPAANLIVAVGKGSEILIPQAEVQRHMGLYVPRILEKNRVVLLFQLAKGTAIEYGCPLTGIGVACEEILQRSGTG